MEKYEFKTSLKTLKINNHPYLKDIDLDLVNHETNEPYKVIAFVGENGCGKTTILNELFAYNDTQYILDKVSKPIYALYLRQGSVQIGSLREIRKLIDGRSMYPVSSYTKSPFDVRLWNAHRTLDIVDKLNDKQISEIIKSNHLDDITCSGEVSKIIDGKSHDYNINNYSSGEQEILLKLKEIKELQYVNSLLLIDEPETSLHPRWQKEIINMIIDMIDTVQGDVPQIFIATHSEKVLESLLKRNDALIVRMSKNGAEPISKMSLLLPKPTFVELDYVIFGIDSYDYHNELFAYLSDLIGTDAIYNINQYIERSPLYGPEYFKSWVSNIIVKGQPKEVRYSTLPVYIRNYFHHPKEGKEPTEEELSRSIDFLRKVIELEKSK